MSFLQQKYRAFQLVLFVMTAPALLTVATPPAYAAGYVVIANNNVAVSSLTRNEARSIFLGSMTRWDDGKAVRFAILDQGRINRSFMQDVVGKTPQQYLNYWRRKIFNGEALAPKSFSTTEETVRFVSSTSGAIGYVPADQVNANVKVLSLE